MKNPWKRLSKINPQREDGTRQINSDVLCALVKAKLPTAEMGIVLTIISKTWGFKKHSDAISISQLSEATGFTHRAIQKASVTLTEKRIIIIECSKRVYRGSPLNAYMFNKHYDTWKFQDTKRVNSSSGGELSGKKRVNSSTPTIETITIEKELYSPNFLTFWGSYPRKEKKKTAFTAYKKIQKPKPSLQIVLESIEAHKITEQWKDSQFIPLPATFLNARQWEDEFTSNVITLQPKPKTIEDRQKEEEALFANRSMP